MNERRYVTGALFMFAGCSRPRSAARRFVRRLLAARLLVGIGLDGRGAPPGAPR